MVAYGVGVDSTAMLIGMVERGLRIDLILFADTGAEVPRTYAYIAIMSAWLVARGYPSVTVVRNFPTRGPNKGREVQLEESLLKNSTVPPLAFGMHTCSQRFKVRPQDRFLTTHQPALDAWASGRKVLKLIGYECGEEYRQKKTFKLEASEKFELAFPLIEWGYDRAECERQIAAAGLPSPGKSACFFCPARKEAEILELAREYPELFQRALAMEAKALEAGKVGVKSTKGLNRNFTWASLADRHPEIKALIRAKETV